jgi:hypothetical protein
VCVSFFFGVWTDIWFALPRFRTDDQPSKTEGFQTLWLQPMKEQTLAYLLSSIYVSIGESASPASCTAQIPPTTQPHLRQ